MHGKLFAPRLTVQAVELLLKAFGAMRQEEHIICVLEMRYTHVELDGVMCMRKRVEIGDEQIPESRWERLANEGTGLGRKPVGELVVEARDVAHLLIQNPEPIDRGSILLKQPPTRPLFLWWREGAISSLAIRSKSLSADGEALLISTKAM
ncbi:unnamed protein product [Peniophora sp. CBMAI 1063]|nr:unnamed protein product [Peniophora sp. CBMAI 1063]